MPVAAMVGKTESGDASNGADAPTPQEPQAVGQDDLVVGLLFPGGLDGAAPDTARLVFGWRIGRYAAVRAANAAADTLPRLEYTAIHSLSVDAVRNVVWVRVEAAAAARAVYEGAPHGVVVQVTREIVARMRHALDVLASIRRTVAGSAVVGYA